MARRTAPAYDIERTEVLGLDELNVLKGSTNHLFYTSNADLTVPPCPVCGGREHKTQGSFGKKYLDILPGTGDIVQMEYRFHKYRCLNPTCGRIYATAIQFAAQRDNVTFRLEDAIAEQVMQGLSYQQVSNGLDGNLSKVSVGSIFRRWLARQEELHSSITVQPTIALISGQYDTDRFYTLLLNIRPPEDETQPPDIRVLDILDGIDSAAVSAALHRLDASSITTVLTDCSEILSNAAEDNLPDALHIIPAEYWLQQVEESFREFAHDQLKWVTVKNKDEKILLTPAEAIPWQSDLDRMLHDRPILLAAWQDLNGPFSPEQSGQGLRDKLADREEMWIFEELQDWCLQVTKEFRPYLIIPEMLLTVFEPQLRTHAGHPDAVPALLAKKTKTLEACIRALKPQTFDLLKARILYSIERPDPSGIPIDPLVTYLTNLNSGGNDNDYQ